MIQKHVRVDMPVIESFGTAGGVRRLSIDADAVELDGTLTLSLDTLKLRISENGDVNASGPYLIVTDIDTKE